VSIQCEYPENKFQDNLEKYKCLDCDRDFITGLDLSKEVDITCPYCQSDNTEGRAHCTDEQLKRLQLGCLGIYYYKEEI